MTPEDAAVGRIIRVLSQFTLIKRELDWYRREEPKVYEDMLTKLREALNLGFN